MNTATPMIFLVTQVFLIFLNHFSVVPPADRVATARQNGIFPAATS
jgi:hypothetical protein